MAFTTSLRVLGGLAAVASARATLTMSKVGGYADPDSEGPLEIIAVKPSTNVSYTCIHIAPFITSHKTVYIYRIGVAVNYFLRFEARFFLPFELLLIT